MLTPPNPLNVVVWGIGRHAVRNVLPALRVSPRVRLAGVCSRQTEAVETAMREYGCRGWTSPEEMLRADGIDAVYLATPVGLHGRQGLAVLESGRHLICEKSLTAEKAEASALVRAARNRELLVFETFMYLYHPRFCGLMERLRAGWFGRLRSVVCNFTLPALEHPGYRYDPALGGGALLDTACYPISLALALAPGMPAIKYAWLEKTGAPVDTSGAAVLALAGDAHAMLTWGYGAAYRNEVTLLGDNGSAHLGHVFTKGDGPCGVISFADRFGKPELIEFPSANSFVAMFDIIHEAANDPRRRQQWGEQAERQATVIDAVRRFATGNR